MNTFFIIILIGLMVMVVVSLVRGIIAFLRSSRMDIDNGGDGNATEMQLQQNKMMFARIKYQAAAIVVVALMMMFSR